MENTNELGLKKYILLADGRVLESSKLKDSYSWKDYSDIELVTVDSEYYDLNGLDKSKRYVEEIIPNWREGESDDSKFTEIIDSKDLLYSYYSDYFESLPLDTFVRQSGQRYARECNSFQYDDYSKCEEYSIGDYDFQLKADEEILLGSWYGGGMRFVAKWDREKKDWVLIY